MLIRLPTLLVVAAFYTADAWISRSSSVSKARSSLPALLSVATVTETPISKNEDRTTDILTHAIISKLQFRKLHRELEARSLLTTGTTGQLRQRLRDAAGIKEECFLTEDGSMDDDCSVRCHGDSSS
jgi:hypothetical protein